MIWFERSADYESIRQVMTHPDIWPYISDDSSPSPEDFYPVESDAVWYVMVRDIDPDGLPAGLLGLWMLAPQNGVCWEARACLFPGAGEACARMLAGWIWENTPCQRIVTSVPADDLIAYRLACVAGMEVYGTNKASYPKDGRLLDQACLGISRPRRTPVESVSVEAVTAN